MINAIESTSQRPYLIRALYEWCTDNSLTPFMRVQVDDSVQVPREYVKDGEIVLNLGFEATSSLSLGNDFIEFKARFGGAVREIIVPIERVTAVFARENQQGMLFPVLPPKDTTRVRQTVPLAVAPRGPSRNASDVGRPDGEAKVMHLVAVEAATDTSTLTLTPTESAGQHDQDQAPADPLEPPRPPAGGGARPALKRIK